MFSTRLHPYPYNGPRRMPFRWFVPVAAVSGAALAAKLWLDADAAERAEREAAEARRRNDALMDVYGDRSSLDELEAAVKFYGKKR